MNQISKVSDITSADLADYLRIAEVTESETNTLETLITVAKDYVSKYTGQSDLDQFSDFVIVVLVLCQDMWDNRTLYVDKNNVNKVVESILGLHSINLLPEDET